MCLLHLLHVCYTTCATLDMFATLDMLATLAATLAMLATCLHSVWECSTTFRR